MVIPESASIPDGGEPAGQRGQQIGQGAGLLPRSLSPSGRPLVLIHKPRGPLFLHCSDSFVRQHRFPLSRFCSPMPI